MKNTPEVGSSLDLLRQIKGAPLTCLQAMRLAGGPVQAGWLCEATGYSAGTVTQALKLLSSGGWVERLRGRRGWLPTARLAAVGLGNDRNFCDQPESRDLYPPTTALTPKKDKPVAVTGLDRKNPDRRPNDPPATASPTTVALRKVLRNAGIGEPKASYLAGLPYVTVEYVCALHRKTRQLGQDARLLIYRIQQNDPMPERCHGGVCPECVLYSAETGDEWGSLGGEPGLPVAPGEPIAPSLLEPAAPGSPFSLAQAWQAVVHELLEGRPSARCQLYLRACVPTCFDPQLDRLTVLAADVPARDWLQARLATLLSRNLAGICCRRVEIRFVTE